MDPCALARCEWTVATYWGALKRVCGQLLGPALPGAWSMGSRTGNRRGVRPWVDVVYSSVEESKKTCWLKGEQSRIHAAVLGCFCGCKWLVQPVERMACGGLYCRRCAM